MKTIKKLFSESKIKFGTIVLCAAAGLILILLSYLPRTTTDPGLSETEIYISNLEEKTKDTLESLTGKGTTKVMITLKNSYVKQTASNNDINYFTSQSAAEEGYIRLPSPEIAGVMIVCSSISDYEDFSTIKKAVSTCLDISQNKIYIIGGKPDNEENIK